MKYGSREGLAAYGYEGYFKVASVKIISAMPDATKKHRQNEQKFSEQRSFQQVLEEARRQGENGSMEGITIGYTRNGQVYIGGAMQRTYTY